MLATLLVFVVVAVSIVVHLEESHLFANAAVLVAMLAVLVVMLDITPVLPLALDGQSDEVTSPKHVSEKKNDYCKY